MVTRPGPSPPTAVVEQLPDAVDLVVLGTGAVGQTAAHAAAKAGWSVVITDTVSFGGTCASRGCDAKKPLVNAAAAVLAARRMTGAGVGCDTGSSLKLDWSALMAFKRSFTDPVHHSTLEDFQAAGLHAILAEARFLDPETVEIGPAGVGRQLRPKHGVVIAVGQRPVPLKIPGAELAIDSDAFLALNDLPERVVFLGGGYISMEFAGAAAVAGRRVTVLQRGPSVLKQFPSKAVAVVVAGMESIGVDIRTGVEVERLERADGGATRLRLSGGEDLEADLVVAAIGREPALRGLDLEAGEVAYDRREGVHVDHNYRSVSNPRVRCAGDAASTGRAALIPSAAVEARVMTDLLIEGRTDRRSTAPVPSAAFTQPTIAAVGMDVAEAEAASFTPRVIEGDAAGWKLLREQGVAHAYYRVVVDAADTRLLGATVVGPGAEEVINVFAEAIAAGRRADTWGTTPFAYPSFGFNLMNQLRRA